MSSEFLSFIDATTEDLKQLEKARNRAEWDTAVNGSTEANQRLKDAEAALMRYWADPDRFATAKRLHEENHPDPFISRQLKLIFLASARSQQTEDEIQELTQLEADVRDTYYNFRGEIDGQAVSDNDIERILRTSHDSSEVRIAWEASKQVGQPAADTIRGLARLRNQSARAHGYRDHFARSLAMEEIDEEFLLDLFQQLDAMTAEPFARYKAELDTTRADRFGIPVSELMPWHYGDRFFQEAPPIGSSELEDALEGQDPVRLALATFDGLGIDVREILDRSDLYPKEGKNQHAFCIDIDREGDIRTLNNLEPTARWVFTLLHELGHAVYSKGIDRDLPWLLRQESHILTTEAIAMLVASQPGDVRWIEDVLGLPEPEAQRAADTYRMRDRADGLVFMRWVLVMTNFERLMYADPERDLDGVWWDLVEKYQLLKRPPGRHAPDWAAKYHIALAPVYYQDYELGALVRVQITSRLKAEFGGLTGRPEAAAWLSEKVFAPGAQQDWAHHIESATGEPLNPRYLAAEVE